MWVFFTDYYPLHVLLVQYVLLNITMLYVLLIFTDYYVVLGK